MSLQVSVLSCFFGIVKSASQASPQLVQEKAASSIKLRDDVLSKTLQRCSYKQHH